MLAVVVLEPVELAVVVLSLVADDEADVLSAVLVPADWRPVSRDWTSEISFDVAVS